MAALLIKGFLFHRKVACLCLENVLILFAVNIYSVIAGYFYPVLWDVDQVGTLRGEWQTALGDITKMGIFRMDPRKRKAGDTVAQVKRNPRNSAHFHPHRKRIRQLVGTFHSAQKSRSGYRPMAQC